MSRNLDIDLYGDNDAWLPIESGGLGNAFENLAAQACSTNASITLQCLVAFLF